jgi:hypothetical protein
VVLGPEISLIPDRELLAGNFFKEDPFPSDLRPSPSSEPEQKLVSDENIDH